MSKYLEESKKYKSFHYSEIDNEMLEYLHNRSLHMLKEVTRILERNNIQYMICGGTLLGAVTTGRFIPWDDDVDMCVFDADYERAKKCLIEELPEDMILQCNRTEKNYYHGWVKVRDKNSRLYPGEPLYRYNGIWIDIYKIIPMRARDVKFRKVKEHINYLKRRLRSGGIGMKEYRKRIFDNRLVLKLILSWLEYLFSISRKKVCLLQSASGIVLNTEWCIDTREYTFEGIRLTGFANAEKYLIKHYGKNYYRLPNEDDRRISINRIENKNEAR